MQAKDGFSVDFKTHKSKVVSNKVYQKTGGSFFVAMIFYEAYQSHYLCRTANGHEIIELHQYFAWGLVGFS